MRTFIGYRIDPQCDPDGRADRAFQDHRTACAQVGTQNLDQARRCVIERRAAALLLGRWRVAITSFPGLRWWRFSQLPYPLVGAGVICAADAEGETCDVPFNTAEMTALTYWIEGRPELPNATSPSTPTSGRRGRLPTRRTRPPRKAELFSASGCSARTRSPTRRAAGRRTTITPPISPQRTRGPMADALARMRARRSERRRADVTPFRSCAGCDLCCTALGIS